MNADECVSFLADKYAGKCYPKSFEEINKELPYFSVSKNSVGRYDISCYNYKGHDNEDRMPYICYYFKQHVFPHVNRDITGYYNIELHDSYTYLNNKKDYTDCLTFAKFKTDNHVVLLPDAYMIGNWGNQQVVDTVPFEKKKSKICWYGTTTGARTPLQNHRIKMCLWSLDKRNICDFYITKIAQMDVKKVLEDIPHFKDIYKSHQVSPDEQMQYRYHLSMDGNTSGWNIWEYKTKSLVFKQKSKEMLWYYPLLQNNVHMVEVDLDNMIDKFKYYENNVKEANYITTCANVFANTFFNPETCKMYCKYLFEHIAENRP